MTIYEKKQTKIQQCVPIIISSSFVFILLKHYNWIQIFMGDTDVKSDNNIIPT